METVAMNATRWVDVVSGGRTQAAMILFSVLSRATEATSRSICADPAVVPQPTDRKSVV